MHRMSNSILALGVFDGVHLGHQALFRRALDIGERANLSPLALTFSPHPQQVVTGNPVPLIQTLDDRLAKIQALFPAIQAIVLDFTPALAQFSPLQFLHLLIEQYGAKHLVCGENFRLGKGGACCAIELKKLAQPLGINVDIVEQVTHNNTLVCSTAIRRLLQEGNIAGANTLLGTPYQLSGSVRKGKQLGRTIGVPTVNISLCPKLLPPAKGVYISEMTVQNFVYPALTNIGTCPTVTGDDILSIETHLLDFSGGELYGQTVTLNLLDYLRSEQKFPNLDALKAQIRQDIQQARKRRL